MNIEEYISSGILEAYVLGELSSAEKKAVEQNILLYPEIKEELRQIEIAQEMLMMDLSIEPNSNVKEKIFEAIEKETRVDGKGKVVTMPGWWKFSLAASIALALVSSLLAIRYYYKWKEVDSNLIELLVQNQKIAAEYNTVNQRIDKIESDLKIANSPSFTRTIMNGTDNAPESVAFVYWNASTQDVYLSIEKMRELSQANQYQLWAIVDGRPVDVGVFDSTLSGLLKMKNVAAASAFAVTIEKSGGSTTPSLQTMQVIGNVIKG